MVLHLEPSGSVFVVFRKSAAGIDPVVELRHEGNLEWSLTQPLPAQPVPPAASIKITKATYGIPGNPSRTRDVTEKLQRIVDGNETNVRVAQLAKGDDPAFKTVKTLAVGYVVGGNLFTYTAHDGDVIALKETSAAKPAIVEPTAEIQSEGSSSKLLVAAQPGKYELQTASGKTKTVNVPPLTAGQQISGPWQVHFAPAAGGPGDVTFDKLEDWSQRAEDGIKYYSGTAIYQNTFAAPPLSANTEWTLDLGEVEVMAEIKLNGKNLGILWKAPYQLDVSSALQPGENELEIKVVNLWINRQIGDENLPEDSDRNGERHAQIVAGMVAAGKPSPTGRISFTSWRLWKKGDPLSPSGLIGPVRLLPVEQVPVP